MPENTTSTNSGENRDRPKRRSNGGDGTWGSVSLPAIVQTVLGAAIIWLAATMYATSGKEADTAAKIKALEEKVVELKSSSATSQQVKATDAAITELKGSTASTQQAAALEDKLLDLKANSASSLTVQNSINSMLTEITLLRNQISPITVNEGKLESASVTATNEINHLRQDYEGVCESLAKLRERIAVLETAQKTSPSAK